MTRKRSFRYALIGCCLLGAAFLFVVSAKRYLFITSRRWEEALYRTYIMDGYLDRMEKKYHEWPDSLDKVEEDLKEPSPSYDVYLRIHREAKPTMEVLHQDSTSITGRVTFHWADGSTIEVSAKKER